MAESELYSLRWKGRPLGPFSRDVIQEKLRGGELSLLHEIKAGDQWITLRSFLPPPEKPLAMDSLIASPRIDDPPVSRPVIRFRAPEEPPESETAPGPTEPLVPPSPPVIAVPTKLVMAGFWRRFFADLVDGLFLIAVTGVLSAGVVLAMVMVRGKAPMELENISDATVIMETAISILLLFMIGWLYSASMESSRCRGTLGKMALGIMVSDVNGARISFGRATVRHFGKMISILFFMFGFVMAGFTKKKQALHDLIADCLVIVR